MCTISVVIPTFNSIKTLKKCVDSIIIQDYPKDKIEIIFADAGSKDGTIELIREYEKENNINIKLFNNPLKTGEAGKAVGVKQAQNSIIALIDSDNVLPDTMWLKNMMEPFKGKNIVASEPIEYTYRKTDGYITRYCALLGMNDPLCLFTGNYDRHNYITNKWTQIIRVEEDKGNYISIKFEKMIPTIGANGFCIRRDSLMSIFKGEYLFDIDILWELIKNDPSIRVAKVKTGIIHLYCDTVRVFARKQKRRIKDFTYFSKDKGRTYPWNKTSRIGIIKFALYCVTIIPLLIQAIIGFVRKPDKAWLFHPVACWITFWIYAWGTLLGKFKQEMMVRKEWSQ